MFSVVKVATPATAATVALPASVPPTGFVPRARVTVPVNPGTRFPWASRTFTCTAGVMTAPAVVVVGCPVNASWLAAPTVMSNAALDVPTRFVAAASSV
jgi:hypothetical protein